MVPEDKQNCFNNSQENLEGNSPKNEISDAIRQRIFQSLPLAWQGSKERG